MHYLSFCIIEKEVMEDYIQDNDTKELDYSIIETEVECILEPYSEHLKVEPYETDCYCKEHNINEILFDEMAAQNLLSRERIIEHDVVRNRRKIFRSNLLNNFGLPDPYCETCDGTGIEMSTFNPDSAWDWWVIGGRWSGFFDYTDNKDLCRDQNDEIDTYSNTFDGNIRKISDILNKENIEEYIPYIFFTYDGMKFEKDWSDPNANEIWRKKGIEILESYKEDYTVVVDCHS